MKTIEKDFAAFVAKLAALRMGGLALETREEPDMGKLVGTLDRAAQAIEQFKEQQASELRDLRAQIDRIETRQARPGAGSGSGPKPDGQGPILIDPKTGQQLITIRAGDTDIEQRCRAAGVIKPEHEEYKELGLGEFLRAVAGQKSSELARRAMSIGTDANGGHLVPSVLTPRVLEALVPQSALLQAGAMMVPVDGINDGAKTYTWAAVNAIPTAAWRNEAGNVAESDPTFRAVVATPRSLAFFFKVTREVLADAANLEQVLPVIIGKSLAKELDRVGLMGSGTAPEPRGVKNTASIQAVSNGANGASLATLRYANLLSAVQAILGADGPMPTAAIMAPRSLVGFASLADTTNQPLQMPELLRSIRMLSTSQIPVNITTGTSNDTTDIYVGDFRTCAYVMREVMSIQRLNELYAGTGQVGFMVHARVDFVSTYPTTLSLISGVRP